MPECLGAILYAIDVQVPLQIFSVPATQQRVRSLLELDYSTDEGQGLRNPSRIRSVIGNYWRCSSGVPA
jgi:hypothetical protein